MRDREAPFDASLTSTALPEEAGQIADFAPVGNQPEATWILLNRHGALFCFAANSGLELLPSVEVIDPGGAGPLAESP